MAAEIEEKAKMRSRVVAYRDESGFRVKGRKVADRWAKWVFSMGGFAIIASILAILLFILIETLPLFRPAKVTKLNSFSATKIFGTSSENANVAVAAGLEENQEIGYLLSRTGVVQFFSVGDGAPRERFVLEKIQGQLITAVWQSLNGTRLVVGTNRGQALEIDIRFRPKFSEGSRSYRPAVSEGSVFVLDPRKKTLTNLAFAGDSDETVAIVAMTEDGRVLGFLRRKEESLFGDVEIDSSRFQLREIWSGRPRSLALDGSVRNLYVGSDDGKIYHWNVSFENGAEYVAAAKAAKTDGVGVAALHFLIGDRTLLVGDTQGNVTAWFLVRDSTAVKGWRLTRIHKMGSHPAAVTALAPSARGKGFISGDKQGRLLLQYTTSERLLAKFGDQGRGAIKFINFAPKANAALTLNDHGTVTYWKIDNPHPEAGLKAFFGKVWYEGYEKPEYVWQSTGGSDDFEPKLSLVPLIFGSLKGTFYALIIALPLAVLGALYTSQFMHPALRNHIKPTIEIMAALPSVVLGFLAGLWLAPIIEDIVPAIFLMFLVLPILVLFTSFLWRNVPRQIRGRLHPGIESLVVIPVIVLGVWLCLALNGPIENFFFGGEFKVWLFHHLKLHYDQRNALVVGFAMGFAVIPIIYTISEDALSNVPQHLVSGSLALGATRWQTAIKVVLPTAAAGIFSAVMIGFGRAVGETMIVLMATGNTPIMDWNIFNGFRTLSANIAVEVPEAPVGGTLYRVLFLAAMLLFMITFLVNTLAEIVRQKLRAKYQKL